jgi:hypothetical protein
MRSERTTPTLGVEISGLFSASYSQNYCPALVHRHCQIGDAFDFIVSLIFAIPTIVSLSRQRMLDVDRRYLYRVGRTSPLCASAPRCSLNRP